MTLKEWRIRRKTMRNLKEAMHGMTLNAIGPIYGVNREKGESNREFERRILKASMASDKIWMMKDCNVTVDIDGAVVEREMNMEVKSDE